MVGDYSLNTLLHLGYVKRVRGGRGAHGGGKGKTGRGGKDVIVSVPLGTVVWELGEGGEKKLIADIGQDEPVVVAKGGGGGRGNSMFATSTRQEPLLSESGEDGERRFLLLELKLLADVGIVGKPNAGKSTLLALCTRARPKVADYPFTTVEPVMGVVGGRDNNFVMMEIPGLLEGAHKGVGLGHQFLRHSERSRIILHILDGISADPVRDLQDLRHELGQFNPSLVEKPFVVAVNKIDILEAHQRIGDLKRELGSVGNYTSFISAATGEGVKPLIEKLSEVLRGLPRIAASVKDGDAHQAERAFRVSERDTLRIERDKGSYVVYCPPAERLVSLANLKDWRVVVQLRRELKRLGVDRALESYDIQPGDTVRIGRIEMEWT